MPAGAVPGERQEVEHREEVDQARDGQDEIAALDQLLRADLRLDRGIQRHQVVQLEDRRDLEEGKGDGGADRRDEAGSRKKPLPSTSCPAEL